ncbi:hypothetical protein DFH09DRAFT_1318093 [Mycena vulgaris]|nr:hypothetical protein DFH09DRAFT_1318093 [Mycena vulgaris]
MFRRRVAEALTGAVLERVPSRLAPSPLYLSPSLSFHHPSPSSPGFFSYWTSIHIISHLPLGLRQPPLPYTLCPTFYVVPSFAYLSICHALIAVPLLTRWLADSSSLPSPWFPLFFIPAFPLVPAILHPALFRLPKHHPISCSPSYYASSRLPFTSMPHPTLHLLLTW